MRILIAVDGSEHSSLALRYVARLAKDLKQPPEIHALFADEPLLRSVALDLGTEGVARYHAESAKLPFAQTRRILGRASLPYEEHLLVGDPAETILKFSKSKKCDLVIMGSHGRSALKSLLLGSVTSKVLGHGHIPLTIIR
ncbi:universal stress protein [Luteimonas sp. 22616]|uniref:universal stress protein n=1 Tax=Luteimonas sp. 22616 TaxID=3453951 RepID=UPI003F841223